MGALEVPVVGVGAEALEAYLSSDRSPPDSMGLSDLDGFLTAVAIGPELVMPSEWLPIVWGGEEPVFADDGEAQAVIGGIMSRYNAILRDVADGNFEPILWITADDIVIATDWAEGFMQGIGLRAKAWEPLLHSKRHALLLFPIFALCGDEHGESLLGLDPEDEDRIMAEAGETLPGCVIAVADYWSRRRPRQGATPDARSMPKPGRNEPCPCGSGKKFKKCCGRHAQPLVAAATGRKSGSSLL